MLKLLFSLHLYNYYMLLYYSYSHLDYRNNLSEVAKPQTVTGFAAFSTSPFVQQAMKKYAGASFKQTIDRARQGDKEALCVIVEQGMESILAGFNKMFPNLQAQERISVSHEFMHKLMAHLSEDGSLLFTFDPSVIPSNDGPFTKFKHRLAILSAKLAQAMTEGEDEGGLSPEQVEQNLNDQKAFLTYLKNINPVYAHLFSAMVKGAPLKGIMSTFAWKSLQSLRSKIDVIRGLYTEFLAEQNTEEEDVE